LAKWHITTKYQAAEVHFVGFLSTFSLHSFQKRVIFPPKIGKDQPSILIVPEALRASGTPG
jgi:hypothetical protein